MMYVLNDKTGVVHAVTSDNYVDDEVGDSVYCETLCERTLDTPNHPLETARHPRDFGKKSLHPCKGCMNVLRGWVGELEDLA